MDSLLTFENCLERKVGSPCEVKGKWKYAIVFQGPLHPTYSELSLRTALERNPDTLLIFSTYRPEEEVKGEKIPGSCLNSFARSIVFDDPSLEGGVTDDGLRRKYRSQVVFLFVRPPSREDNPYFWKVNSLNQSLQRLTSYIGLEYARRLEVTFACKTRTDIVVGRHDLCSHLEPYAKLPLIIPYDENPLLIRGRLVWMDFLNSIECGTNYDNLYCFEDLFLFGYLQDVLMYFSIEPINLKEVPELFPEISLSNSWIKRVGITKFVHAEGLPKHYLSLEILARYGAVISARRDLELYWAKADDIKSLSVYLEISKTPQESRTTEQSLAVIKHRDQEVSWLNTSLHRMSIHLWTDFYKVVCEAECGTYFDLPR